MAITWTVCLYIVISLMQRRTSFSFFGIPFCEVPWYNRHCVRKLCQKSNNKSALYRFLLCAYLTLLRPQRVLPFSFLRNRMKILPNIRKNAHFLSLWMVTNHSTELSIEGSRGVDPELLRWCLLLVSRSARSGKMLRLLLCAVGTQRRLCCKASWRHRDVFAHLYRKSDDSYICAWREVWVWTERKEEKKKKEKRKRRTLKKVN